MSFFNIISVVKGEKMKVVRQSQTIKMTNVDNKIQTKKEICKHGNMPISIREIICGKNMVRLLESPYHTFREVYLKSLQ